MKNKILTISLGILSLFLTISCSTASKQVSDSNNTAIVKKTNSPTPSEFSPTPLPQMKIEETSSEQNQKSNNSEYDNLQNEADELLLLDNEIVILECSKPLEDESSDTWTMYLDRKIHYPSLNSKDYKYVNEKLKLAALSFFKGNTSNERVANILNHPNYDFDEQETNYKVLMFDEKYISIMYSTSGVYSRMRPWANTKMITIDLYTKEYVTAMNITKIENIIIAIQKGDYVVRLGGYYSEMPENLYENEIKKEFIEAISKQISYEEADTIYNFGMDKENIYIYFYFNAAQNGYIVLQIPRSAL